MRKHLYTAILLCAFSPAVSAAPPDWSGFFKPWENGCDSSKALDAFVNSIGSVHADSLDNPKRFYLTQALTLPPKYRPLAAKNASFHKMWDAREQYRFDQVRLALKGQYYGLPVVHYSQTFLLETAGVTYYRLLLDAPTDQARRVLAGKYRPRQAYNPALEGHETLRAELLPVNINGKAQTVVECRRIYG